MTDPTQRQVDADIERSIDLFRRADVGPIDAIQGRRPKKILIALDGSPQDRAAVLLGGQLRSRLGCTVGYHRATQNELEEATSAVLREMDAEDVRLEEPCEHNYDQILAAINVFDANLVILPCPFGRNFESIGEDSTGTVLDVVTARAEIPVVAIRRPDATGRDPTSHLRIILTGENPAAEAAARWAVGLVHPAGRLELLLLVEKNFYDNVRQVMQSLQPDVEIRHQDLENALADEFARLHAGLRHAAANIGFDYELLVRYEADEQPITPEHPQTHPALMVLALVRHDHDSQAEVHDYVRRSPHPLLVVSVR